MSDTDYTLTISDIRRLWSSSLVTAKSQTVAEHEFDRTIARVVAEAKAEALKDAAESGEFNAETSLRLYTLAKKKGDEK